jgi:hypothetical protein
MPNGRYDPACYNCDHYSNDSSSKSCRLHDFTMPLIRYNGNIKICRDFALRSEFSKDAGFSYVPDFLKGEEFGGLKSGSLYYDASYAYGRQFYGELDRFDSLKNFVFDVEIFKDDEFGWAITLERFSDERKQFPRNGSVVTLQMGDTGHSYSIARTRKLVFALASQQNNQWVVKRVRQTLSVIYSETSPTTLRDWLDEWIDAEAAWEECTKVDFDKGIVAFVETIDDDKIYRLRPAPHFSPQFLRQ